MARPFLFGGSTSGQSQNKYLVEFRAGKMSMKDRIVTADKRKGTVFVHQTDDSLMHFCWKDRTTGTVEDDLIIFPDDVVFKRVHECTTGRVFVLKFKSSSRKSFYWLQEPKTDRDNEYCTKVNQYLNNPPSSSSRSGAGGSSTPSQSVGALQAELNNIGDGDLQNLLNNMSQQQLIQLLGGVGSMGGMASLSSLLGSRPFSSSQASASESPRSAVETPQPPATTTTGNNSTTTTTTTTTTATTQSSQPATPASASGSSIQLSDLQNILSGLNVPAPTGDSSQASVDLSSAITTEALQPLFNNKELMDRLKGLLPPASSESSSTGSSEQLRSTVQSPQFQQALSAFSYALHSGQLGSLMQQFGMSSEVVSAANSGDMDAFVRAMQNSNRTGATPTESPSDSKGKDDDKDEDMSLD